MLKAALAHPRSAPGDEAAQRRVEVEREKESEAAGESEGRETLLENRRTMLSVKAHAAAPVNPAAGARSGGCSRRDTGIASAVVKQAPLPFPGVAQVEIKVPAGKQGGGSVRRCRSGPVR
ncbi:MAG: hypothetical protein IPP85_11800 [Propionivibrio sp.]|nr:hypothetical protein [Propionivibrio sp.]